ncbi:MAG: hypothetical protein WB297_00095 [Actinomycetota bacterium]
MSGRSTLESFSRRDPGRNLEIAAALDGSHALTVHAKMLRLELLSVKRDLERELGTLVLDRSKCGPTVHPVTGHRCLSGLDPRGASTARRPAV